MLNLFCSKGDDVNDADSFLQTPLFYAARDGKAECIKRMIEIGANVNHKDRVQETALFYAAREGQNDVCKVLLDNGADINIIDHKKQTALYFAKKMGHKNTVQLLIEHGAINTKDGRIRQSDITKMQRQKKKLNSKNVSRKADGSVSDMRGQTSIQNSISQLKRVYL